MSQSMEPEAVAAAFAYLDLHNKREIARIFGKGLRTVQEWFHSGAPPHIALAISKLVEGSLPRRGVKFFLKRVGRMRDDRDRYTNRDQS